MTALDRPPGAPRILRLLALPVGLAASAALTGLLAVRLRSIATADLSALRIDQAVEIGVVAIGAALTAWLALSLLVATACAAARVVGGGWAAGERLVHRCAPTLVRRTLVLAVGAGLGLSVGGVAHAADTDLGWTPTTTTATADTQIDAVPAAPPAGPADEDRAHTAATDAATITVSASTQAPGSQPPMPADLTQPTSAQVVVAPGDSLWKIAADHLGPDAGAAEIAAAWPRWHETNAAAIGADPDVIHPGQTLDAPSPELDETAPLDVPVEGSAS
ncbi:LysM peptidoglycan-binding domain-containing protein [Cellulomonas timonensis]|uniref:LysM peptidoglycan-binding domain-containing protein n=1 Tax=Cellulomonas timonensis TaxID=1689271 RepID=UPI000830FA91|nr:LysM domain-containing protein [Cellulomonas timonensis]